jgi:hypothetical protein
MKKAVSTLLQLNLKRFRVARKTLTAYSGLDVMKQALELLFEFSPSEKSYREAIRTIDVYSEGDAEMVQTLKSTFKFVANAIYNTYAGQRCAEKLSPETLFLQGLPFNQTELQQAFRFFGVRPLNPSTPTVKKTYFLDQGYEAYKQFLDQRIRDQPQKGREEHWVRIIEKALSESPGTALMRVGVDHVKSYAIRFIPKHTAHLVSMLKKRGIEVETVEKIANLNRVFGKH